MIDLRDFQMLQHFIKIAKKITFAGIENVETPNTFLCTCGHALLGHVIRLVVYPPEIL
jgi:hypothetical protein